MGPSTRRRGVALAVALSWFAPLAATTASEAPQLPFLLELRGEPVSVLYTPGSLDRAVRVQRRFEPLAQDFADWSRHSTGLAIVVLSREEWSAAGLTEPYGLPGRFGERNLALPAWGDPGTVELWRRLLHRPLPALPGAPIRGTPEEAASLFLGDVLGEIDGARLLLEAAGYSGRETWVAEVTAHAVARSAFLRHESGQLGEIEGLFAQFSRSDGESHPPPLDRFSSSGDLEERLWYQARFFEAARVLSRTDDRQAAKKLLKRARKRGGTLAAADLLRWYPGLSDWLEHSFER